MFREKIQTTTKIQISFLSVTYTRSFTTILLRALVARWHFILPRLANTSNTLTVRVTVRRVEDEHASVPPASLPPIALDVGDEEREVLLRQLRVQLAAERHWVSSSITVIAWSLILLQCDMSSARNRSWGVRFGSPGVTGTNTQQAFCRPFLEGKPGCIYSPLRNAVVGYTRRRHIVLERTAVAILVRPSD